MAMSRRYLARRQTGPGRQFIVAGHAVQRRGNTLRTACQSIYLVVLSAADGRFFNLTLIHYAPKCRGAVRVRLTDHVTLNSAMKP